MVLFLFGPGLLARGLAPPMAPPSMVVVPGPHAVPDSLFIEVLPTEDGSAWHRRLDTIGHSVGQSLAHRLRLDGFDMRGALRSQRHVRLGLDEKRGVGNRSRFDFEQIERSQERSQADLHIVLSTFGNWQNGGLRFGRLWSDRYVTVRMCVFDTRRSDPLIADVGQVVRFRAGPVSLIRFAHPEIGPPRLTWRSTIDHSAPVNLDAVFATLGIGAIVGTERARGGRVQTMNPKRNSERFYSPSGIVDFELIDW